MSAFPESGGEGYRFGLRQNGSAILTSMLYFYTNALHSILPSKCPEQSKLAMYATKIYARRKFAAATSTNTTSAVVLELIIVVATTLFMRLLWISSESPWYDEVITLQNLDSDSFSLFLAHVHRLSPAVPPLYFILEYYYAQLVGGAVLGLRMLSIALGCISSASIYLLARQQGSRLAGLLAGLCYAISSINIYFDQEIRMYALVVMLASLSMTTLWAATHGRSRYWWLLHYAANAGIIWTQPISACLLVGQASYIMLISRDSISRLVRWTFFHLLLGIAFAVWFSSVHVETAMGGLNWINRASFEDLVYYVLWPAAFVGRRTHDAMPFAAFIIFVTLTVFVIRAFYSRSFETNTRLDVALRKDRTVFLLIWLLTPALTIYIFSLLVRPAMIDRYVLVASPALFLLIGFGVADFKGTWKRLIGSTLILACAISGYANQDLPARVSWFELIPELERSMERQPNSLLYVWPYYEAITASYYLPDIARNRIRGAAKDAESVLPELTSLSAANRQTRLLLIVFGSGTGEAPRLQRAATEGDFGSNVVLRIPRNFVLLEFPPISDNADGM